MPWPSRAYCVRTGGVVSSSSADFSRPFLPAFRIRTRSTPNATDAPSCSACAMRTTRPVHSRLRGAYFLLRGKSSTMRAASPTFSHGPFASLSGRNTRTPERLISWIRPSTRFGSDPAGKTLHARSTLNRSSCRRSSSGVATTSIQHGSCIPKNIKVLNGSITLSFGHPPWYGMPVRG